MEGPWKGDPVNPCMDVYKAKIQYDGSLDKLHFRIVVGGDLYNNQTIGDTWSPTSSRIVLGYFLEDYSSHKSRVHQSVFVVLFIQANVKHGFFVKLDRRYGEYFPEYCNYFGIPLITNKSMYVMNNYVNIFTGELTYWMIDKAA